MRVCEKRVFVRVYVCTPMWPYMLKCLTTQFHGGNQWQGAGVGEEIFFTLYFS